jgi:hypothetical protein
MRVFVVGNGFVSDCDFSLQAVHGEVDLRQLRSGLVGMSRTLLKLA